MLSAYCLRSARILITLAVFFLYAPLGLAVPIAPTELEQYMLELINRARANPVGEAARFGIDLNEGLPAGTISSTPKQPVAFNFYLNDSAEDHSQWMIDNDVFQHEGPGDNHPKERAQNAGYILGAPWGVGENLAWQGITHSIPDPYATTTAMHEGLFVDAGIDDRGHRTNMLLANHKEIGIGIVSGVFEQNSHDYNAVMITADFAYTAGNAFLTGVVYQDDDHNQFYSPTGEGYDNIAIQAFNTATGATYETTTFSTGGYSLQVPPGTYYVTVGGGDLLDTIYSDVSIGTTNLKLDVVDSQQLRPWSNPLNQFDADFNGTIEPHDVLVLIDELNRFGPRSLAVPPSGPSPTIYFDVNRDAGFSSADILHVIDAVNRASFVSSPGGSSSGGLLTFIETSDVAVPEPNGIVLAWLGLAGLLTIARLRGKLL